MYTLMKNYKPTNTKRISGVSLIEVLIALLVFSIGLQGIASLQYQSVKENFDSAQRTHGIWAAQELINRIQANPEGRENGDYIVADLSPNCSTPPDTFCADGDPKDGNADVCNAAQMAAFDLWDTFCLTPDNNPVQKPLTNLSVTVACNESPCQNNSDYTLTLGWRSKAVSDDTQDITDDSLIEQEIQRVFRP
jgi:type IV pilus modification protein PilV